MRRSPGSSNFCRIAAWFLAMLPLGCGHQDAADPDQARHLLVSALDAWHDGLALDAVSKGSLAMTVADPSWQEGFKLTKYEIAEATKTAGFDRTIGVELWLEDAKGKPVRKKVKYTVSLQPSRTVLRSPL